MPLGPASIDPPTIRVLLVDDDEAEFVLLDSYLKRPEEDRFELSSVRTYGEGLAALREGRHDVYLVDHRLGAETGLQLIEQVREEGLRRPVILLTGVGSGEVDRAALCAGAFDYLEKSDYREADLRRTLRYAAERGRIEGQLHLHAEILANVHDAVFLVDEEGVIRSWNHGAEQIFGVPAEQAIGSLSSRFCPRLLTQIRQRRCTEFSGWCQRASGERVMVAVRLRFLESQAGLCGGAIVCANDITEQVRLEQLICDAAEAEQRRIGQDIHDDLCQQLAGAACGLKVIEQKLARDYQDEVGALGELGALLAEANTRAREISRGLFPSVLQVGGLTVALEDLADRLSRSFGISSSAVCGAVPGLPVAAAVQLYRIAQEATGNAVRHAKATRVEIRFAREGDQLVLSVRDDGEGMKDHGAGHRGGIGLLTMAHRTRLLGGDFDIHSASGTGTEVRVAIPFPTGEAKDPVA